MSEAATTQLPGLFITGADTGVGKTYVASLIARQLAAAAVRVGVYKPAASGCRREGDCLVSDDAVQLWEGAGRPGSLEEVCPQRFSAPLAPNVAARAEGRKVDDRLLRHGLDVWKKRSNFLVVEGAGGWLSPLSDTTLVADLAKEFQLPVVVVARNALGTINHTLLTVRAVRDACLPLAAIVFNDARAIGDDSAATNPTELARWTELPIVRLSWDTTEFRPPIDWLAQARRPSLL